MSLVYRLYCTDTRFSYIGSTKRKIRMRYHEHKKLLVKNSHWIPQLQEDWNLYGESSFTFTKLANVNVEQFWCDFFSPMTYNIRKYCDITQHSEETKAKIGAAHKGRKLSSSAIQNMKDGRRNLTESQIILIRQMAETHRQKPIAEKFDVSIGMISMILSGTVYSDIHPESKLIYEAHKKTKPKGSRHLTDEQVREIRSLYPKTSVVELTKLYPICERQIYLIIKRKRYADVD